MRTRRRNASRDIHWIARPVGALFLGLVLLALAANHARGQVITEFTAGISLDANLRGIASGPNGNLWFAEYTGPRIGRITPLGAVTEFSAGISPGIPGPFSIRLGPDGNLWFTETQGNRIGRITPLGVITEFSNGISPNAGLVGIGGITAGPDGNVWFTEGSIDRIGRIVPSTGVVTEFSAGITAGAGPFGITAGPDGNLWFTEANGHRIGRITPLGVVTEFSTGISGGATPYAITAGPDGNLWFTEYAGQTIGRITPLGVVTEFSAGITAASHPSGIAAGPDGNLWFTEQTGRRIGRITPLGVVTEYSAGISANAAPYDIAAGSDGNMWFTEIGLGVVFIGIGRITMPPPALASAVSRKVHGAAGTLDMPLVLTPLTDPTTEPRQSATATIVMTFDAPIVSASVAVTEGIATAGAPILSGNDVIVPLTGVADQQYVTITATSVDSAVNTGGGGSVRIGFLVGDVNQSRVVSVADLGIVNSVLAQAAGASNYLMDVNASGSITVADKGITNANLTRALPAP